MIRGRERRYFAGQGEVRELEDQSAGIAFHLQETSLFTSPGEVRLERQNSPHPEVGQVDHVAQCKRLTG